MLRSDNHSTTQKTYSETINYYINEWQIGKHTFAYLHVHIGSIQFGVAEIGDAIHLCNS